MFQALVRGCTVLVCNILIKQGHSIIRTLGLGALQKKRVYVSGLRERLYCTCM
jgi:hypothetical protein